jgi:hypothetical protein
MDHGDQCKLTGLGTNAGPPGTGPHQWYDQIALSPHDETNSNSIALSSAGPKPSFVHRPKSSMPKVEDVSVWLCWAVDPASALRVLLPPLLALPRHFLLPLLHPYLPPSLQGVGSESCCSLLLFLLPLRRIHSLHSLFSPPSVPPSPVLPPFAHSPPSLPPPPLSIAPRSSLPPPLVLLPYFPSPFSAFELLGALADTRIVHTLHHSALNPRKSHFWLGRPW